MSWPESLLLPGLKESVVVMKEGYIKKLQAQLGGWSAEIEKLKAKAEKAEGDAQLEY